MHWSRREFLQFMGRSSMGVAAGAAGISTSALLGCAQPQTRKPGREGTPAAVPGDTSLWDAITIKPSVRDDVVLAPGLSYRVLIKRGDAINTREKFGDCNDFTAFLPLGRKTNEGLLWVNHEAFTSLFVSGVAEPWKNPRRVQDYERELLEVGGSIIKLRHDGSQWNFVPDDRMNRRVTAKTRIRIVSDREIGGSPVAVGTLGNCAGGVTPWSTILTCEELYDNHYGDLEYVGPGESKPNYEGCKYNWVSVKKRPPEHYGWVVEIDPFTGFGKKLTSLGRFGHECALVVGTQKDRCAVYTGDDSNNECLYKFVADKPGSLEKGTLYVANLERGRWIPIDWNKQPELQKKFKDQTEALVHCRVAAHTLGGTPLDRPEDIERDPQTGAIIVALTNNKKKNNAHGSLLKIMEKNNNPLAEEFESATLVAAGHESGFTCPDNLAFDSAGNLWVATDISGRAVEKGPYRGFGNNGLFVIPMSGGHAGRPMQVASAPVDAEFTGLTFLPNGDLIVSVQHPGEHSPSLDRLTSHWPEGGSSLPKSSVIVISGEPLKRIYSASPSS